jgi:hypothetical protein
LTATVSISDSVSTAATILSGIGGKTSGTVTALSIPTITGTASEVIAALVAETTKVVAGVNVAVTIGDIGSTNINATTLSDIGSATGGSVTVSNAVNITGTLAQVIAALVTTASQVVATSATVGLTTSITALSSSDVTDLNAIDMSTTGIITATLTGVVADLKNLTNLSSNNAYTITVTDTGTTNVLGDTPVSAADLKAIDLLTNGLVNASSVQYISGLTADIQTIYVSKLTNGITLASNAKITVTDSITPAQLNLIDFYTTGMVTASVSGTASDLNTLGAGNNYTITVTGMNADAGDLKVIDASTPKLVDATVLTSISGSVADVKTVTDAITNTANLNGINLGSITTGVSNVAITLSDTLGSSVTASNLKSIVEKTSGSVTFTNAVAISGSLSDVTAALVTDASLVVGSFTVGVSDTATASQINAIAAKTTGVVTATISDYVASTLIAGLLDTTVNAYTISVADTSVNAADLNTLDGKTTVPVSTTATTITGTQADITQAIVTAATSITTTGTQAITLSNSANVSQINAISAKTSGNVTAIISDNNIATLVGLSAESNNAYTITVTDAASIAQLTTLRGKTTIAPTYSTVQDTVANLVSNVGSYVTGSHAVTIATDITANAADLNTINGLTEGVVDATNITNVTGAIGDITTFATAEQTGGTITAATNYALNVNSGNASVAQVNVIDADNGTGIITATISDHSIATLATLLSTGTPHAYTISVTDAASVAQLTTLDGKTSVTLTYAALNDSIENLITDAGTNANQGTYVKSGHNVTVTNTASFAQLKTIDDLADTVLYTSITDTAANLVVNTGTYVTGSHSAIVSDTGTVTAAQLNSINVLTTGLVDASLATVVTGTVAEVTAALVTSNGTTDDKIKHSASVTIDISDRVSIAALTAIDGITTGTVNYTSITDTAANLATLSGTTWTANSYITSGKNVFITGNIDPAELAAIDAANVNGTVTLLDLRLSAPTLILDLRSSAPTLTSSTYPNSTYPGIITNNTLAKITNNTVAKINDAPGDQTFEIEAGGNKLVLESVKGHNEIKFDGYLASELSVTYLGTTAIFTASLDPNKPQIASIAMTNQDPSQTITYRDGSHVELTLTGTTLALDGVIILNTGTIL